MDSLVQRCKQNLKSDKPLTSGLSAKEAQQLRTRYSTFQDQLDDNGFIISSNVVLKSLKTPRPYLHMMASSHFRERDQWGSFWDQHRGGFSCVDSILAGKMTSHQDPNYVPTSPASQDVRDFYVHEDGKSWPMFPVAGYEDSKYKNFACTEGLDQFEIQSTSWNIHAQLRVCVHKDQPLEVWKVTLTNSGKAKRSFEWFLRLRINLDSYPAYYFDPRVVCEGLLEEKSLVFISHDKNNKHPRSIFLTSYPSFNGYDMMEESFDDKGLRSPIPIAVQNGRCFNSFGQQPYSGLIAAAQFHAELKAGQTKSWAIAFGKCPQEKAKRKIFLRKIQKEIPRKPEGCFKDITSIWESKVLANAIQTPDQQLNRYFNVWSKYQARGQSRFIRGLDKVGYRDIIQDLLGITDFEPSYVRSQLVKALHYQFPNGTAVRQYEKFAGGGHDLRMYQDSPVWIPDTLIRYLKETGDFALLSEKVPYLDPKTLQPNPALKATVYEHACRAVKNLYEKPGFHGLCSIGYGDWNDAISAIGGNKGVSVWLSCACVYASNLMVELAEFMGKEKDQKDFLKIAKEMTLRINRNGWDGAWYVYALNQRGVPIGSRKNPEGKIHLNVNTWSLFTGVAEAGHRSEKVWKAIQKLATPVGHQLLKPSYTVKSRNEVGRIADQLPGMFENGSIYTHGEAFYLYALACDNQPDRWYEEIMKTLPSNLVPDLSTSAPHQQSNFFVGPDHPIYGTNLYSNFTGSLAWYRRSIEKIIGVIPEFDGLRIAPMPPRAWNSYRVTRMFRGRRFDITFRRGKENSIKLNGKECGNLIQTEKLEKGKRYKVEVRFE